jgi:predicted AAA+ superfamily ATPase
VNKETLKYVLTQSTTRPLPLATTRTLEVPLDSNKIVALVWIRRSGKTFLLYETMRRLEAKGVDRLLLRQCLGHPASLFNVHRLYQDFRSQGLALSKDTLYNYLGYLEQSFIVFPLSVAERSLRLSTNLGPLVMPKSGPPQRRIWSSTSGDGCNDNYFCRC